MSTKQAHMQPPRFSVVLRQGFEDALGHREELRSAIASEPDLASLDVADLPRLARDPSVSLARQDRLLAAIIRCYRREASAAWAGILLEALAPGLVLAAAGLVPIARALTQDDVEQELVVAALRAAATMPLPEPPERVQRRLTMRASWEALRALLAAAKKQRAELEGVDAEEGHELDEQHALFELAEIRVDLECSKDLALLLGVYGRGETFGEAGHRVGLTPEGARSRCRRLASRIRSAAA